MDCYLLSDLFANRRKPHLRHLAIVKGVDGGPSFRQDLILEKIQEWRRAKDRALGICLSGMSSICYSRSGESFDVGCNRSKRDNQSYPPFRKLSHSDTSQEPRRCFRRSLNRRNTIRPDSRTPKRPDGPLWRAPPIWIPWRYFASTTNAHLHQ